MAEAEKDLLDGLEPHVVEQIKPKTWEQLEVLEHAGYLLFPLTIYSRKKDGTIEETKVRVRIPRNHEVRAARAEARTICIEDGIDPDADAEFLNDIEGICILARSIRNNTDPHEQWVQNARELEKRYDRVSLQQAYSKLDSYGQMVDPRPNSMSEGEVLQLVATLASERNISPLHAYGSDAQTYFIVTMADHVLRSVEQKLLQVSSEPSTPVA